MMSSTEDPGERRARLLKLYLPRPGQQTHTAGLSATGGPTPAVPVNSTAAPPAAPTATAAAEAVPAPSKPTGTGPAPPKPTGTAPAPPKAAAAVPTPANGQEQELQAKKNMLAVWQAACFLYANNYCLPLLFALATLYRLPFVILEWTLAYSAATALCFVCTQYPAARSTIKSCGGWILCRLFSCACEASCNAWNSARAGNLDHFAWMVPSLPLAYTAACFFMSYSYWWVGCSALLTLFVYVFTYSERSRTTVALKLAGTSESLATFQDMVWDALESMCCSLIELCDVKLTASVTFVTLLLAVSVTTVVWLVRIASQDRMYAQMVLLVVFVVISPKALKKNAILFWLCVAVTSFIFCNIPASPSAINIPTQNTLRSDDVTDRLWKNGLTLWNPMLRLDHLVRCKNNWDDAWCIGVMELANKEVEVYRKVRDDHLKQNTLFYPHQTVNFVGANATQFQLSIRDVTGTGNILYDITSGWTKNKVTDMFAGYYMLIDAYERTNEFDLRTRNERDRAFSLNSYKNTMIYMSDHGVKAMAVAGGNEENVQKLAYFSWGFEVIFNVIQWLTKPIEELFEYDNATSRDLCSGLRVCNFTIPNVKKCKPQPCIEPPAKKCKPQPCTATPCIEPPKAAENVTDEEPPKAAENVTDEEPPKAAENVTEEEPLNNAADEEVEEEEDDATQSSDSQDNVAVNEEEAVSNVTEQPSGARFMSWKMFFAMAFLGAIIGVSTVVSFAQDMNPNPSLCATPCQSGTSTPRRPAVKPPTADGAKLSCGSPALRSFLGQ